MIKWENVFLQLVSSIWNVEWVSFYFLCEFLYFCEFLVFTYFAFLSVIYILYSLLCESQTYFSKFLFSTTNFKNSNPKLRKSRTMMVVPRCHGSLSAQGSDVLPLNFRDVRLKYFEWRLLSLLLLVFIALHRITTSKNLIWLRLLSHLKFCSPSRVFLC